MGTGCHKIADSEEGKISPWDYRYYSEKFEKKIRSGSECEGTQLENLREGMFWVAGELFDLQFKQITNVPVYADVRVWEVSIKRGKLVGLWYFDRMPEKENVLALG
jgi:peptidyl-dipeptidase Dcp